MLLYQNNLPQSSLQSSDQIEDFEVVAHKPENSLQINKNLLNINFMLKTNLYFDA